ncbi:mitochondrial carrier domain-containing protein [Mortierella sp. GBAus27b]|nr:mitochondrial adenine nucleotide carrier Anc1 [Mortierella sp. GBA43]KAI8348346.1 mitochondrial carrier domain-containing protein [Mortierella sp. GBAus27b]
MPCSHPFGLGLGYPLVLNTLTAPAERIQLLLRSQDEVILNLREESLALDDQRHRQLGSRISSSEHPQLQQSSSVNNFQSGGQFENNNGAGDETTDNKNNGTEDDHDDEPRSIIVPYAYLPFTDMKDCFQRLVDKEGYRSLWRGYRLEAARFVLQAIIETTMQRKHIFSSWFDLRRWVDVTTESFAGSTAWVLGAAVEGTLRSAVALVIVYPLATLHVKMATDMIRRTKTVKPTIAATDPICTASEPSQKIIEGDQESVPGRPVATDLEAPEWIEHDDSQVASDHGDGSKSMATSAPSSSLTVHLSYRYQTACNALQSSLGDSEGIVGLYKGFSAVLISTFVSRLGSLGLYRIVSPWRSVHSSKASIGAFLFVFGATSILNLVTYPLGTVCHRRMIAAPGRYSSSWDTAKHIVQTQGWSALFKGCEVVMIQSAVVAVMGCILR